MEEGTSIKTHINEYNSILLDLENLTIEIGEEDATLKLLCSLPSSYKHFQDIMLYGKDFDVDVLIATNIEGKIKDEWIMDAGCSYHICPNSDCFSSYELVDGGIVLMGNNAKCKVI